MCAGNAGTARSQQPSLLWADTQHSGAGALGQGWVVLGWGLGSEYLGLRWVLFLAAALSLQLVVQLPCASVGELEGGGCFKITRNTHPSLLLFVVQSLSCVQLFVTPWTAACQASLSFTIFWSLLKLMSLSRWCHPTISPSVAAFSSCLQSFPASRPFPMSQLFASGSQSVIISPDEYSELISFRIDWFDILAIQGTLKSLP